MFFLIMLLPVTASATKPPADGQYTIEVTLSGGSGRAQVQSPAALTVTDGMATAVVIWKSPNYEYMRLGGVTYYPVSNGQNSIFAIPVPLDEDIPVRAQTIAMSRPHEIDYRLRFDSATMKPLSDHKSGPSLLKTAAVAAAVLVVLAGAGCFAASKRRAKGRKSAERK